MVYFVVGIGRSGTSTVARILHNDFNIHMGDKFASPDETNPNGYWEDIEFRNLHNLVLLNKMHFTEFNHRINILIKERNKNYKKWGIKDPKLCYFLGCYLNHITDCKIIICKRDKAKVIESLCKCYRFSKQTANNFYEERNKYLENILSSLNKEILEIDFNKKLEDNEIKEEIKWLI